MKLDMHCHTKEGSIDAKVPIQEYITKQDDGIPWIKIGDVNPRSKFIVKTDQKITVSGAKKSCYLKKGDFILSNSMSFGRPYILAIDGCIHDGWIAMSNFERSFNSDFLFYLLRTQMIQKFWRQKASSGTVQNLNSDIVRDTSVPVPPLPVQEEIVRILDKFTALEARRKQYEFYRDQLLTFGDEVEWRPLGEIGRVCMCKRIMKNETSPSGEVPFYKIGTFGKKADAFISRELYNDYKNRYSFPTKGTILISASGTIGRTVIYNGEDAYFQDSNIVWINNDETKVLNKFLFYLYKIVEWKTEGGTIARLYNDSLCRIRIPVPPLAEQERIVAILDKFDALANDISSGLPAELEMRRKQYEYSRDRLLTFKPLAKEA